MKAVTILCLTCSVLAHGAGLSTADYPSIQAALDANPDKVIFVPAGDHLISEKIRIRGQRSGLFGPGRIIQQNPEQPILELEGAHSAEVRDLTLTRPEGRQVTDKEAITAIRCQHLVIENIKVIDNLSRAGAISIRECRDSRVSHCLVRNYMRISVDDRTASANWGYAFNCTDGTGISVSYSTGTLLEGNRIVEENLIPTPEIKSAHKLGDWVKKNPAKGLIVSQQTWDAGYTDNWQQGSGIVVTAPKVSDATRIIGNHIENAAQGMDIHCDHVIVANNIVINSFVGMKSMHGSRNVLINGNQFIKNCLWAIGLMPGAGSDAENRDGGSLIANNIISDFGHGDAAWVWGQNRSPFKFEKGQEADDPPLTDVLVTGNVVHRFGEPRYAYAVIIEGGPNTPQGLRFTGNHFMPGTQGLSNRPLNENSEQAR